MPDKRITDLPLATQEMGLFMNAVSRLGKTWFMTQGNHECYGGGCNSAADCGACQTCNGTTCQLPDPNNPTTAKCLNDGI